jgi:hypothetical protein
MVLETTKVPNLIVPSVDDKVEDTGTGTVPVGQSLHLQFVFAQDIFICAEVE